eukprot:8951479-Ditylum_brightwellii.AAC.1
MMIRIPQARQNDSIDVNISISTYVVGFIYYGNEAYDDDTVILTRDKLCCFDDWATTVSSDAWQNNAIWIISCNVNCS